MMTTNERASCPKERMLVTPATYMGHAYYMTKFYQKAENLSTILHRAHTLADTLNHMTICTEGDELVTG